MDELLRRRVAIWVNPELHVDGVVVGSPDVYVRGAGVGGELDSDERHGPRELLDMTLRRDRRFTRAGLLLEHVIPRRFRSDPAGYVYLLLATAPDRRAGPGPAEPSGLPVVPRGPLL